MDSQRRKELMEQYKQTRTQMGVYCVRCGEGGPLYLGASRNLPAIFNSYRFQLNNGAFPHNRRLLADWQKCGPEGGVFEILEELEYDKDNDLKTDYREDLAVLKEFWREKLLAEGCQVENVSPKDR